MMQTVAILLDQREKLTKLYGHTLRNQNQIIQTSSDIEEIDGEKKVENLSKMEFKDAEGDGQLREAPLTSIKQEGSF